MKPSVAVALAIMSCQITAAEDPIRLSSPSAVVSVPLPVGWHRGTRIPPPDLVLTRFDPGRLTNAFALPDNGAIVVVFVDRRSSRDWVANLEQGEKSYLTMDIAVRHCAPPAVCKFAQVERPEPWIVEAKRRSLWRIFECGASVFSVMLLYDASYAETGLVLREFEELFGSLRCDPKPSPSEQSKKPPGDR